MKPTPLLPLIVTVWTLVGFYVSILVHEAGHALMGWLAGYRITSCGMGLGKIFLRLPLGRTCFFLGAVQPMQGITWAVYPHLYPPRRRAVLLLLGGVLANSLLAFVAAKLCAISHGPVLAFFVALVPINILFAVTNILPLHVMIGGYPLASDGAQVLNTLRPRGAYVRPISPSSLLSLRSLWEAVGDKTVLHTQLLSAASTCLALNDTNAAQPYLEEAEALPTPDLPALSGYTLYLRGIWHRTRKEMDEAVRYFADAERLFQSENCAALAYLTRLGRAETEDSEPESDDDLERTYPLLGVLRHGIEVRQAARYSDTVHVEAALARYEAARRRIRSDSADYEAYLIVAQFRETNGDLGGATIAYEAALAAAKRLYDALTPDPETQDGWGERCRPLCEAAARNLRLLNRSEEADKAARFIPSHADGRRIRREAKHTYHRKWTTMRRGQAKRWRIGAALTLVNAALIATAAVLWQTQTLSGQTLGIAFLGGLGLGLVMVPAALTLIGSAPLHFRRVRFVHLRTPIANSDFGLVLIVFAVVGWVAGIALGSIATITPPRIPSPPDVGRAVRF